MNSLSQFIKIEPQNIFRIARYNASMDIITDVSDDIFLPLTTIIKWNLADILYEGAFND